jgi:hypothetical protein
MKLEVFWLVKMSQQVNSYQCMETASVVRWLACWPLVPEFAGSNPAEVVGFFQYMQHAFLRRGSERICPMSQLCGM